MKTGIRTGWLFFMMISFSLTSVSGEKESVDPSHLRDGGFGYLIQTDTECSVWWAEGCYKVMKDAPLPSQKNAVLNICSAKNEFESVIVSVNPKHRMENFRITAGELSDGKGNKIGRENITIRKVEYVKVSKPTDSYGFTGYWPDPLPVYSWPEIVYPSENQPFWITFKIPEKAQAGNYKGEVTLSSGNWALKVPVNLKIWDFTLPRTPSMRSGFGMEMNTIKKYENLRTPEEERKVFGYYMESFRDYKLSPYDPFEYTPIVENVKGVAWDGGYFDSKIKYAGNYSYRVEDNSPTSNSEGKTKNLTPVSPGSEYRLSWTAKSQEENKTYTVGVECYNAEKELLVFENRFETYQGTKEWKGDTLRLGKLNVEVKFIKIRLFPTTRTITGEEKGTIWFDDLKLMNTQSEKNELDAGNFEVNLNDIDIELDFKAFNEAGKKYFNEFGFTGFRLSLKGLGSGTYYSRKNGVFEGFEQGTDEYNKLMQRYLAQMQENLEKNGWLGKEYIYWFDEPLEKDYPFVKESNALIRKYAPKLTTFLTEHVADQDISDVTDISCTIWHKLNHNKIRKMNEKGLENWSYLCCWPKSPWISEFIDHDAINLRMWLWASWQYQLKGILIWSTTWWNSESASPEGYLQNPWDEPMSFVSGYGWPWGKQTIWGNGDGRFFYPVNRDPNHDPKTFTARPVPSVRLEIMRDGIEDYDYFALLAKAIKNAPDHKKAIAGEATKLLAIPTAIYTNETTYTKDPRDILEYRKKLAEYIVLLK